MDNAIEQIKSLVNTLNIQNTPLMKKPSEDVLKCLRTNIDKGKYIKTRFPQYRRFDQTYWSDQTYWCYPNGVEEKIEDDKTYKVWF